MESTHSGKTPTLASGRFELLDALGEGGMALVCRARDTRLGVERALKVLLPQFADRHSIRARFIAEARTMARLDHDHIVRAYDVASDERLPFLVMELVRGGNLSSWMLRNGPMPPRMAVRVCIDTARGAAAAHRAGVVHRDIKPHNVLITASGACKLTDFGIARNDDGKTRAGLAMGTPGYMAPEQRTDASSVDARADVFSIGVTLWTLLNARMIAQLELHVRDNGWGQVPPALQPIIAECVRYDREQRLGSADELIERLEECLSALPPDPPGVELWQGDQTGILAEAEERPTLSSISEAWDRSEEAEVEETLAPEAHTLDPSNTPVPPPSGTPVLPYSMSRPMAERRARSDELPEWVDRSSLDDGDRGFTVSLTDEEGLATSKARQLRHEYEEWERSVDSTAAMLAERSFDPGDHKTRVERSFHKGGRVGLHLLALPIVVVGFVLVFGGVAAGVQKAASADLARSYERVEVQADREAPLAIQLLVSLGGRGTELEQRYLELEQVTATDARIERIEALISEMETQLDAVVPTDPSRRSPQEVEAVERVKRLRADLEAYQKADDAANSGWFFGLF